LGSATPPGSASASAQPASGYQGLGVESIPPEVLAKHAAPALPPNDSRRIQAMLDVRAPGAGIVAPDGKRMYFTWSVTGTTQIWRLDGPMSFPTQLTGGEDTTLISDLTPDGKRLLVSRDRSGEENPGLYLLSPDGGELVAIQHKAAVQTFLNAISDDSRFVYYSSNDLQKDAYALYRYEIATGKRETLYKEPGLWRVADHRKGGAQLLLSKSVGSNMTEYFELDPSPASSRRSSGKASARTTAPSTAPTKAKSSCSRPRSASTGASTVGAKGS
jgi:Tol biopolymer transport system component